LATLKQLREAAFLTQMEVAQRLGVAYTTVNNWEHGKFKPRLRFIPLLAELYGVTPQEIKELVKKDDDTEEAEQE
jgi:transcriptional regulator with XRE-family HTH domain